MTMMGPGPWAPAQEAFNRFRPLDRSLCQKLNKLSEEQAHDDKLAWATESGRIYGLRQMKYGKKLHRELKSDWRRPPVERMW